LSCTTAPLYDHEGRLVAALDVLSCKAELIENFVNLLAIAVIDAAARIESECFRRAYPDARILVVPVPDKMGKACESSGRAEPRLQLQSAMSQPHRLSHTFAAR
jgi:transcriptional regulator of acetoin/glycerol metabolism